MQVALPTSSRMSPTAMTSGPVSSDTPQVDGLGAIPRMALEEPLGHLRQALPPRLSPRRPDQVEQLGGGRGAPSLFGDMHVRRSLSEMSSLACPGVQGGDCMHVDPGEDVPGGVQGLRGHGAAGPSPATPGGDPGNPWGCAAAC